MSDITNQPSIGPVVRIGKSMYDALRAELAAVKQERDALAAIAPAEIHFYGPCERCGNGTDISGDCPACRDFGGTDKIVKVLKPAAILAARDTRKKNEGAAEALEGVLLFEEDICFGSCGGNYVDSRKIREALAAAKRQEAKG